MMFTVALRHPSLKCFGPLCLGWRALFKYYLVGTCHYDLKSRPIYIPNFAKTQIKPIFIPEPQILSKID